MQLSASTHDTLKQTVTSDKFSYVLYADDTSLLTNNNLYNLYLKLNHELHNIFKWVSVIKLTVNIKKKKLITYCF